jgi:hypothetical protein
VSEKSLFLPDENHLAPQKIEAKRSAENRFSFASVQQIESPDAAFLFRPEAHSTINSAR